MKQSDLYSTIYNALKTNKKVYFVAYCFYDSYVQDIIVNGKNLGLSRAEADLHRCCYKWETVDAIANEDLEECIKEEIVAIYKTYAQYQAYEYS